MRADVPSALASGKDSWRDRLPISAIALAAGTLGGYLLRQLQYARGFPIVHDAAIMHYVLFMIGRGHAPYTSMLEMNLPGSLMSEWLGMHIFGGGPLGLWMWDASIGVCAVFAAAWVTGRGFRTAGAAGAMLAWTLHLYDGAWNFGERDWLVALLMLLSIGCAAAAIERKQSSWFAPAIAFSGWACAIKPYVVVLPAFLLAYALWVGRRRSTSASDANQRDNGWTRALLLWSAAGASLPLLAVLFYLHHWPGAFAALLHTESTLGAWYGSVGRATWRSMFVVAVQLPVLVLIASMVYLYARGRPQQAMRPTLLLFGAATGAVLYVAQRKGFHYHLYPFLLCLFPAGFAEAQRTLQELRGGSRRMWDRAAIAIVVLLLGGWRLPVRLWAKHQTNAYPIATQQALIQDLTRQGGAALSGHVQCMDMTLAGCIGALYDLRLEQSTGFVNDFMLFSGSALPFLSDLQQRFLGEIEREPPRVIVLSAHNWPDQDDFTFSKLSRWPAFAEFLNERYRLASTHVATTREHTADYRIYVLR